VGFSVLLYLVAIKHRRNEISVCLSVSLQRELGIIEIVTDTSAILMGHSRTIGLAAGIWGIDIRMRHHACSYSCILLAFWPSPSFLGRISLENARFLLTGSHHTHLELSGIMQSFFFCNAYSFSQSGPLGPGSTLRERRASTG